MSIEDKMRELRGRRIAASPIMPYRPITLAEFRRTPAGQELDRLCHQRGFVFTDITQRICEASLEHGVDPATLQGCYAQTDSHDANHITLRFFAPELEAWTSARVQKIS